MPETKSGRNRANAQHSTGPHSILGKRHSSLNWIRQGLTSQSPVLPTEDAAFNSINFDVPNLNACLAPPKLFLEIHKYKGNPYDPADDGFVFANAESPNDFFVYWLTMHSRSLIFMALALFLSSCSSATKVATPVETLKPHDESRRFPTANLVDTNVVNEKLLGKSFMPGGTLARYKKGKIEYEMFIARLPTATDAAVILPDWRTALSDSKLIPSFGGYFGRDADRPVFVFSKGPWIAGIVGLPEKDADLQARSLAAKLD